MTPAPSVREIERQTAWELHCIDEGVKRYRRTLATTALADTPPGQIAVRDMMKTLIPKIEEARQEAIAGIASGQRGRKEEWWWYIAFLSAEELAFIVTRAALTNQTAYGGIMSASPLTNVANAVGAMVKTEIEFALWKASERQREKDATAKGVPYENLYREITSRAKKVDAKAFARWRKKLKQIERLPWTIEQKVQIGAKLLDLLVRHGGGWFECDTVMRRGKTTRVIRLTEIAKDAINDINANLEVNRPFLLPMKCQPKPWEKLN